VVLTIGDIISFEHILKKNGFHQTIYRGKTRRYNKEKIMDDWFGTLTTLSLNPSDDKITFVLERIDTDIQNELINALKSVSTRNNNHVILSNRSKNMILRTNKFKIMLENRIKKLSADKINYAYTLSLLSKVNSLKNLKQLLAYNYFNSIYYKDFSEHASNNFLSFLKGSETNDIYYQFIKIKKPKMTIKEKEKSYLITVSSENKYEISYSVNKQCHTSYSNRRTEREVENHGDIYNRTYQDKTYGCSIIGGLASSRSSLDSLFARLAQNRGFSYKKSFLSNNNLIASTNREEVESKYVGVDKVQELRYKESRCSGLYVGQIVNFKYNGILGEYTADSRVEGVDKESGSITLKRTDYDGYEYVFNTTCLHVKLYN